ncbi:MAG: hypothetical protein ACXW48_23685, partial [Candidatus Binatia bacterium]
DNKVVKTDCKSPIFFLSKLGVLCALAGVDPLFGYCGSPEILRKFFDAPKPRGRVANPPL